MDRLLKSLLRAVVLIILTQAAAVGASATEIYGWLRYDERDQNNYGPCRFDSESPGTINVVFPYAHDRQACAAAYADGKYYAYLYAPDGTQGTPLSFGTVSLTDGSFTEIASYQGLNTLFADMAYDYSTSTMYAIGNPGGTSSVSALMTVNLTNGDITVVGTMDDIYVALACSYDGQMYAIRGSDGYLLSIDKTTGSAEEELLYTWEEPEAAYFQSMEFDHATGKLYWTANTIYQEGVLVEIDLETFSSDRLNYIGNNAQIVGLYIPFEMVSDDAPAAVADFVVTPGAEGALSASLSWTNPSLTVGGADLTAIDAVEVYRDGALIATVTENLTVGAAASFVDTSIPASGTYAYSLRAVNSAGRGISAAQTSFVGRDVPKAPASAAAEKAGDGIAVSWTAPSEGVNGGWIDASSLRYSVTRLPDAAVVCEETQSTTFTDSDIPTINSYSYRVTASTADGTGGSVTTNAIVAGPSITVPYYCNFATDEQFGLWTVVNANNDYRTWERETTLAAACYYYNEDGETGGDDWLISSPIALKAGKTYRLRFKLQSYDVDYPEMVAAYIGQGTTVEAMTTQLGDYTIADSQFQQYEVLLPPLTADGDYNLGFHCHSDPYMFVLYLTDIELEEVSNGSVSGTVTSGSSAVEGAVVAVSGTELSAVTGADGTYSFAEVEAGGYTLVCSADGYATVEQAVTVDAGSTATANFALTPITSISVAGRIVGEEGTPLDGATVTVTAYETKSAVTAADGSFSLSGVATAGTATISVARYAMQPYEAQLDLSATEISLGDIALSDKLLAPFAVTVAATDEAASVAWQAPLDLKEYRHDSGTHDGRIGRPDGTENTVFGAVYRTPARLTSLSWYTENYLQEHAAVSAFVFDLDEDGNPTSTILFRQDNVANTDNQWTTLALPAPVDAPRGCMVAISFDGHVGLGLASVADTDYQFAEMENCYSVDYTTGVFTYTENDGILRPMMIRAAGVDLSDTGLSAASTKRYDVYRLLSSDTENSDAWTKLTAAPVDGLAFTDTQWAAAPQGIYRYAVKTVYSDGEASQAALSGEAANKMLTTLTVNVTTNTPTNEAEGAAVVATCADGDASHVYTAYADATGAAVIDGLWKGVYSVEVSKRGFSASITAGVDLTAESAYTLNLPLEEYVVDPYNLEVRETGVAGQRTLAWNVDNSLFDDFEGHDDFAVNSAGEIGWTYADRDGAAVLPIDGVSYPNAEGPMAFMVFNPYATDPVLGVVNEGIRPHSGEKFLATFACASGDTNDDYIISPELSFSGDFTLKFFAKSYSEDYGLEKINAGYSTTDNAPDSFTWLNGDSPIELPMGDWVEYAFTVPADAKYVAINCVSDYLLFVMIDDVFVGVELPEGVDPDNIRDNLTFEVYLDGEIKGTTADKSYTFSDLANGTHTAGVKAVFSSVTTPLVEKAFTVSDNSSVSVAAAPSRVAVYPNPTDGVLTVVGEYTRVEVVSLSGAVTNRFAAGEAVSIAGNPDGVYFVRIFNGDSVATEKVILRKR